MIFLWGLLIKNPKETHQFSQCKYRKHSWLPPGSLWYQSDCCISNYPELSKLLKHLYEKILSKNVELHGLVVIDQDYMH